MVRDARVAYELGVSGWSVLRFWESDIRADPERVADEIAAAVRKANERDVQTG